MWEKYAEMPAEAPALSNERREGGAETVFVFLRLCLTHYTKKDVGEQDGDEGKSYGLFEMLTAI